MEAKKVKGIVFVLCVLLLLLSAGIFGYWKYQNAPGTLCKNIVLQELKAPKTAEFENVPTYTTFPIYGSVHSQNSYGALVKSEFRCGIANGKVEVEWL